MGGRAWVPSFWTLEYTTGFADGALPKPINELIGCFAAIDALSLLATTNRNNSVSSGMDGFSQSQGSAGPAVFDTRIKLLEDKKQRLLKMVRGQFGSRWAMSNV
jgi:hypothetical protein